MYAACREAMKKNFIVADGSDFTCRCGNNSHLEGAYPCDHEGNLIEPPPDEWPDMLFRCDRCKLVFNGDTGEIIKGGA